MGKTPVVAIVGLIWAGMALVGCENCKNCRPKYNPAPTFGPKSDAPDKAIIAPEGPPPAAVGAAVKAETPKVAEAPKSTNVVSESPAVGLPVSAGPTPSSPTTLNALRPSNETRSMPLPGQGPDYHSGETPVSFSGSTESGPHMPPRPSTTVGVSTPVGSAQPLPTLASSPALPTLASSSALPPPPMSSMPMLNDAANGLPPLIPPSK